MDEDSGLHSRFNFFFLFAQKAQTGFPRSAFTGTWEFGDPDKGWYPSIDVKKDTVITFSCMDHKSFPSVSFDWHGDTLVVEEQNFRHNDEPTSKQIYWLSSIDLMNCDDSGCFRRVSYKPQKLGDCGFD